MVVLCQMLQEKGYGVTLVTFADTPDHYLLADGIKRVRLGQGKSRAAKMWAVFRYFLTVKTDCVISFGQRENMLCLLPLTLRRVKVLAGERNYTEGRTDRTEKLLMHWLYRRATYVVPNSYSQKEHILSYCPEWRDKVITIVNYTDLEQYKAHLAPQNSVRRIAVFGRYAKQKNCQRFAQAIQQLKKRLGTSFVVEWYGNQSYKGAVNEAYVAFQETVDKLEISDVLHLNNHVKDVAKQMEGFDAVCLPSLWEGFSNSLSEAICCGKPVVASHVSDNTVMVKEGVNGFTFEPTDIQDMTDVLERFLRLPDEELVRMGRESRRLAESLFDKDKFIDQYLTLIN